MSMLIGPRRSLLRGRPASSGPTPFDFDAASVTFTPKMAKRTAPGPFAAAPIVQGKWTPSSGDSVVVSRGTLVSGSFYTNFDAYQGSIVFWVTPEWNGNDSKEHNLVYWSATAYIAKATSNVLVFRMGDLYAQVSAVAWTAGTTYCVVVRWDIRNTLDGAKYVCISVNDSHTFADDATGSTVYPAATWFIGSNLSAYYGANAIIEGLTIYRRPLFDGTYGVDVGNGDELALIYAAGAGKDPTELTGSFDVCLCVPTNATAGELATGTGEAWSHPHASALLTDTFAQTTYGSSAWTAEGTPSIGPADMATAQKIFAWGYSWTNDAADEGIYQDVTVAPGDTYILRMIAHADGTSQPKLVAYDQDNTAEIASDTGTTTSTRAAPDVLTVAITIPAGCTTMRVKVINVIDSGVMYVHQVEMYATDATFSAGEYAGINSNGTIANAVLQVGSGTTALGHEVARITGASPTLFVPVKLTPVTLTVTPASQANSTETSGIRVDGLDTMTQPIANLTATSGQIRWDYTPRHSAADAVKFGNAAAYIAELYGAADNYIRVYWSAANTITLAFDDGGGAHTTTWDATGAIVAGTTYLLQIDISAAAMTLSVDGVVKATITTAISFATVPTAAHWGASQAAVSAADSTFAAPTP